MKWSFKVFFPPACRGCGRPLLDDEDMLCDECYSSMPKARLGRVIVSRPEGNDDSGLIDPFLMSRCTVAVATVFRYRTGGTASDIIKRFKYNHRPKYAIYMGRCMAREFSASRLFEDVDFLVPVPLTEERKDERGYNQSELLCQGIAEITGTEIVSDALIRTEFNESQTYNPSLVERLYNVRNSFAINGEQIVQMLEGKHIALIDDVMTTGATTCACVDVLKDIPGIRITVATLAKAR